MGDLFSVFIVILECPPRKTASLNAPQAGITELVGNEDSAVATLCEVLAVCAVFGGAKLSLKINDIYIYIGTRDSQYVTLVKDSYTSSSLIASASNGLFPLPSFFQEFARSI